MTINTPTGPAPEPDARPLTLTAEQLEQLGAQIERLYNLAGAMQLPLRPELHLDGLRPALPAIARELRRLYAAASGDDPWADGPEGAL